LMSDVLPTLLSESQCFARVEFAFWRAISWRVFTSYSSVFIETLISCTLNEYHGVALCLHWLETRMI
jgi:hypothetical protein